MIGTPYGNSEVNGAVGEAVSHVVSPTGSKGYMQGFTDHYRAKSMTSSDIREVEEGRMDAGDGILEGNPDGRNCCVCDTAISGSVGGAGGMHTTSVYRCTEVCDGECKWRVCAEPSTACMYRFDHRIQVRDSLSPNAVPQSILIHACTRDEAQAEADNACTDNACTDNNACVEE